MLACMKYFENGPLPTYSPRPSPTDWAFLRPHEAIGFWAAFILLGWATVDFAGRRFVGASLLHSWMMAFTGALFLAAAASSVRSRHRRRRAPRHVEFAGRQIRTLPGQATPLFCAHDVFLAHGVASPDAMRQALSALCDTGPAPIDPARVFMTEADLVALLGANPDRSAIQLLKHLRREADFVQDLARARPGPRA